MSYTPEQLRSHRALLHAAAQVGARNYATGAYRRPGYCITPAHAALTQGAADVLAGRMSVNDAFALVTSPEVMQERFGS